MVLETAGSPEISAHEPLPGMPEISILEGSRPFLDWLETWFDGLQPLALAELVREPSRTAVVSVDLINGFCYQGNLASPRIAALLPAVVDLFKRAHAAGVAHFLMIQECHSEHAAEFEAFGPHGICGTGEADMVDELASLPFADRFTIIHKNSLHTIVGTRMEDWLAEHLEVDTFIVVGDCTDLCVFDAALDLKLRANITDTRRRVVVPENCVQTYDLPLPLAQQIGAMPHDGNFLHRLYLYQMALNKIDVVKSLT